MMRESDSVAIQFDISAREVLEQVVREPRFRSLTTIPIVAPVEMGLIIFAYLLFAVSTILYLQGTIPWIVCFGLSSVAIYAAFTPLHDATHRTVSGNRKLNDLLGTISTVLLLPGITTRIYRYLHLEHHRFAGDKKGDPDEPFVSWKWPWCLLVLAGLDLLWTIWYLRHWTSRPVSERIEFTIGIAIYVGLHAVFLLSPYWMEFLILWVAPQRTAFFIITYFFARIQHPEDVLWEAAPFQATASIRSNLLQRIIMLGQTDHHIHHLAPSVPFYRYYRAVDAAKHLLDRQNIPTRNFFAPSTTVVLPDHEIEWIDVKVAAVRDVATDVREYELRAADGEALPAFESGGHIDIRIDDLNARQYSMLNSPLEADRYVVAVKREADGRGGSRHLYDKVSVGQTLTISKPRNNFPLGDSATDYVLIGGGIGMTPVLSMAHALAARGATFELHLLARDHVALPYADDIESWPFADRVAVHLDQPDGSPSFDPAGMIGSWREGRELYICGPGGFMAWVESTLSDQGWPSQSMFSETFLRPKANAAENTRFEVELARSGRVLTVEPDQYLLDVLNANHCAVICSCTQGICGSCITPVLDGIPEHRDAVLSDTERAANDKMCVCVGRAKSERLVLDL
jgi:vanillate O-demethylase ferredoxin subunit